MTAAYRRGCPIVEVNVGGGLGVPGRADEEPVDLDAYAAGDRRHLGPLGVAVGREPGDYIAKDTAILLGEVVTVEERRGTTVRRLDLGWNVDWSYFIYRFPQEIVVCRAPTRRGPGRDGAGHINEAADVFAEDYPMPPVEEGDIVALLNAGGYHQAMARPTACGPCPRRCSSRPSADRARRIRRGRRSPSPPPARGDRGGTRRRRSCAARPSSRALAAAGSSQRREGRPAAPPAEPAARCAMSAASHPSGIRDERLRHARHGSAPAYADTCRAGSADGRGELGTCMPRNAPRGARRR